MITETEKWNEAKKQAIEYIIKHNLSKNIRFAMALRGELQKIIDEHHRKVDEKNNGHKK